MKVTLEFAPSDGNAEISENVAKDGPQIDGWRIYGMTIHPSDRVAILLIRKSHDPQLGNGELSEIGMSLSEFVRGIMRNIQ